MDNIDEEINLLDSTPLATYHAIGIAVGWVMLCFGYRFYKPCLFCSGAALGAVTTFVACLKMSHIYAYGAAVCAGIIGGTLSIVWYHLGVFFSGALWGLTVALLLNGLFLSRVSYVMCECNHLLWLAMGTFSILLGLLCVVVHEHKQDSVSWHPRKVVIFMQTAFPGAYILMRGVGFFLGGFDDELEVSKVVLPSRSYYGYIVGTLVLALLGSLIQMRLTHHEHCGCADENERQREEEERKVLMTKRGSQSQWQ